MALRTFHRVLQDFAPRLGIALTTDMVDEMVRTMQDIEARGEERPPVTRASKRKNKRPNVFTVATRQSAIGTAIVLLCQVIYTHDERMQRKIQQEGQRFAQDENKEKPGYVSNAYTKAKSDAERLFLFI